MGIILRQIGLVLIALSLPALWAAQIGSADPVKPLRSSVHPIINEDGYLFGGANNGRWLDQGHIAHLLGKKQNYVIYGFSKSLGVVTGGKPVSVQEPCPNQLFVDSKLPRGAVIGLAAPWNALPRTPRLESASQAVYQDIVRQVLRGQGLRNPKVQIDQVIRCDLDGDGTDEVLISAHRFSFEPGYHDPKAGDYSIVLMRRVIAGKASTVLLGGEVYRKNRENVAPNTYQIKGVYDLNGDGRMEVVVGWKYYEGSGDDIYEIKGAAVDNVLSCGCGA